MLCASLSGYAEKITLTGSDLLEPIIAKPIESAAKKNGIDLTLKMEGTYAAVDAIKNGTADVAIIALPRSNKLPEGLTALPFAYQAAIVIVNTVNPIEEITTKQLTDIFSISTKLRAETWQQIGVKNIGLRNIMPITTSLSDNVVVELFKYTAMNGTNIGQWVYVAENKNTIYNMIKANNSAIGIIGKLDAENGNLIKIVSVSKSEDDGTKAYAFKPDRDNIFNGDYPLTLPFYIVFKKENAEKIKSFARILLSDDIANKIDKTDFFSAPASSRKKSIFNLDIPQ
jgi:hypothetical protein